MNTIYRPHPPLAIVTPQLGNTNLLCHLQIAPVVSTELVCMLRGSPWEVMKKQGTWWQDKKKSFIEVTPCWGPSSVM